MQCQKEQNLENCPCSYPDCPRKGICCECVSHHREKGEIPACFFPAEAEAETASDRTVDNFIKSYQENKKKLEIASRD
ncbi:MAG: DUF6485 family protein [Parcubacteria group bacterium]|jgi:hypothetical protein